PPADPRSPDQAGGGSRVAATNPPRSSRFALRLHAAQRQHPRRVGQCAAAGPAARRSQQLNPQPAAPTGQEPSVMLPRPLLGSVPRPPPRTLRRTTPPPRVRAVQCV